MMRQIKGIISIVIVLAARSAAATTVDVVVTRADGHPAPYAVVEIIADDPTAEKAAASHLADTAVIDQRDETFLPLVTILRRGGQIVFSNNDHTKHQVYSFSPIRQFSFEIDKGHRSPPVTFDTPGVAAIGCNIHDHMVTFVYVAASPWAVLTDQDGHARIDAVPPGKYRVKLWHPQQLPGYRSPKELLLVSGNSSGIALSLPLLPGPLPGKKHAHSADY